MRLLVLAAIASLAGCAADRTPTPVAAMAEPGAREAAEVARAYFALIGARRYAEAWALLADDARPSGRTEADFAAAFADYAEYHAEVGAPGRIEGAAGSLWVEVPARVFGRMRSGERFAMRGVVVLRRCNAVPGCTDAQRRWRIVAENIGIEPVE